MAESTRAPQTKAATAATASLATFPLGFVLAQVFPQMTAEVAVGVTALIGWVIGFAGATARDWIFELKNQTPPGIVGFWVKQLSKVG